MQSLQESTETGKKLKGQERNVHRNQRNTCVMCGMKYTFDGMLNNHIESIQKDVKPELYNICKVSVNEEWKENHIDKVHVICKISGIDRR